uniref:L-lactate dehydrogenase complex protein LldE n=1 Tax=Candidatus Kentrum sp. DK TaxID=2126562 RepID=A0A450S9X1_9GAMM|nr:MAG: L-lactate dehydrogenase complex protein LldE [Candidatus Kentron sp. DK]
MSASPSPRVGFLITCLADIFRPTVGFAGIELLSRAGCRVAVPEGQTCCGQFAYNSGDVVGARLLAKRVITGFAGFDYVATPSGSCATMLKKHYRELFHGDRKWEPRAQDLAGRCFELTSFLVDIRGSTGDSPPPDVLPAHSGAITYHDSCTGLRELGIRGQPRALLGRIKGLRLQELGHPGVCCGFGGSFCLEFPEISAQMVSNKVAAIQKSGADILLGGDLGCLINIAGRLERLESPCKVYHVAEVLAGIDAPPIGGGGQASPPPV